MVTLKISKEFAIRLLRVARWSDPSGQHIGPACADLEKQIIAQIKKEPKGKKKGPQT